MTISFVDSIDQVTRQQWGSLDLGQNPFIQYQFLSALEQSGSVGDGSGWQVHHLLLHDDQQGLIGAVPCYLKQHSYGEYVFDWGWADAYRRAGIAYYPRMVCAVPFTPATGSRLLVANQAVGSATDIRQLLAKGLIEEAQRLQLSSVHCLFLPEQEADLMVASQWLPRHDLQFHWRNNQYQDFDDFLASFSSKKRKNVKRERRRVSDAGIKMEIVAGDQLNADHWRFFYRLYRHTAYKRGGTAYLTEDFFNLIGENMADSVVMVFAKEGERYVAAALNFRGGQSLYGRYWGCLDEYDSLHFETCYYSAIEYCIDHQIELYEAGAQGEHKLSRGFMPTTTRSAHWLAHPQFAEAVADFLDDERQQIAGYQNMLNDHAPFKSGHKRSEPEL
ncbi:MAG: N-acetyltransferase [Immundisolibacteraceae bacterium]|nr:N-acetyltransferase [Immundisolibacteraceae bacterium]